MSSKRVVVLLQMLVIAAILPNPSIAQTPASPESQIQHIITAQEVAWNVGNSASWTSAFTPDADFIMKLNSLEQQLAQSREDNKQLRRRVADGGRKHEADQERNRQLKDA